MFSFAKVTQVPLLSASHASILSWSVSPRLARPDVMNNSRVAQLTADINTVLSRPEYNKISYGVNGQTIPGGPMEQLLRAISSNCSQLILQCSIGKATFNGYDCCAKYFDPIPYFTDGGKNNLRVIKCGKYLLILYVTKWTFNKASFNTTILLFIHI